MFRIGQGYDVHRLVANRKLILGGVEIPYALGLLGHSDADVALHALMDAILGALARGDIGKLFPDTDDSFKDISSMKLLEKVAQVMGDDGYRIVNADITIVAQAPKLAAHIDLMREATARGLCCAVSQVSVKATTTEKLGFTGRGDGIAAEAVVLLEKVDQP
ncbi:MAG: 2-C-methyl-D-erythritol 2,4-cyclodiphosphate synthase [Victivallaceae bacterium]|nr:2-C-methyl-D-erythritol 2,4-cyclodiphosphate synthase [Victivallaceae bacterium]